MSRNHLAGIGCFHTGKHAQERRLAGSVQTKNDDATPPIDCEIDCGEDLERSIPFRETTCDEWRPTTRCWFRKAELRDVFTLSLGRNLVQQALGSTVELVRGSSFCCRRAHAIGLVAQGLDFALRAVALSHPTSIVGSRPRPTTRRRGSQRSWSARPTRRRPVTPSWNFSIDAVCSCRASTWSSKDSSAASPNEASGKSWTGCPDLRG